MKIVHVITRLILGGAQENTLLTCLEQARLGHEVVLLAGPPAGPEGSLLDVARAGPYRTILVPALVRAVRPWSDLVVYWDLLKHLRDIRPDVVHAGLREGLARVLPQAGVCRRPVVTYDMGGAREIVRDGENGFLC